MRSVEGQAKTRKQIGSANSFCNFGAHKSIQAVSRSEGDEAIGNGERTGRRCRRANKAQ